VKTTILIVEDDEMIRELMDITLSQAGYAVLTAGSGEAALDLMRRVRVGLVLLDVHMPRMSGIEVLATMRRRNRAGPPVLMVTANRQPETVQKAISLGCAGYVAKPFAPGDLLNRVARALAPTRAAAAATGDVLEI